MQVCTKGVATEVVHCDDGGERGGNEDKGGVGCGNN